MALDILENCSVHIPGVGYPSSYEPVKHTVRHELESLVWVIEYALFRRAHKAVAHLPPSDENRKEVEVAFAKEFGSNTPSGLSIRRWQTASFPRAVNGPQQRISPYLDDSLRDLIPALMGLVKLQNYSQDQESAQYWSPEMAACEQKPRLPMTCDSVEAVLRRYAAVKKMF